MRDRFAPSVSGLEGRKLMTGSLNFGGGTLSFYADAGSSHAVLSPSPAAPGVLVATIDGQTREFSAADVKLVMFYSSDDGRDSFENDTDKTSISDLAGDGNRVVGGTGADFVVDYGGTAEVDDQGGGALDVDASGPGTHGYSVSVSPRTGSVIVKVK